MSLQDFIGRTLSFNSVGCKIVLLYPVLYTLLLYVPLYILLQIFTWIAWFLKFWS